MKEQADQLEQTNFQGFKKTTPYNILQLVAYNSQSVSAVSLLKEITGSVTVMAFNSGVGFDERTIAFDSFLYVIDGALTVAINNRLIHLVAGEGITLPAHNAHAIKPGGKFKIILTTLKGGNE